MRRNHKNQPDLDSVQEAQVVSESTYSADERDARLAGSRMGIKDYLIMLFRHKWKILVLGLSGSIAALCVYLLKEPVYVSRAELYVPYIVDRSGMDPVTKQVTESDFRNVDALMDTEVKILRSWDLAKEVASKLNGELSDEDGEAVDSEGEDPDSDSASEDSVSPEISASEVSGGLEILTAKGTAGISLAYYHIDSQIAVKALQQVVNTYKRKHVEIRRSGGAVDDLRELQGKLMTDLQTRLGEIETLKLANGILSVPETFTTLEDSKRSINESIIETDSRLSGLTKRLEAVMLVEKKSPASEQATKSNSQEETPNRRQASEYENLLSTLHKLEQQKQELLIRLKPDNDQVKPIQNQIDVATRKLASMEKEHPGLVAAATPRTAGGGSKTTILDPKLIQYEIEELRGRRADLETQKTAVDGQFANILGVAAQLDIKERSRKQLEEQYTAVSTKLDDAEYDLGLSSNGGSIPNIKVLQEPSVALSEMTKEDKMLLGGLAFGGFALGILIALVIEMFIDNSIKRPKDLEAGLHLPLMLSIPYLIGAGSRTPARLEAKSRSRSNGSVSTSKASVASESSDAAPSSSRAPDHLEASEAETPIQVSSGDSGNRKKSRSEDRAMTASTHDHFIAPFADAIRDRLEYYFEINNLTHKPKLVALTGFSNGAGTSTLASGLAASFADVTSGKILYVDLNQSEDDDAGSGSEPNQILDDALSARGDDDDDSETANRPDNLFVASVAQPKNGKGRSRQFVPKKFYELLPQFKTGDFDYVVFDMPPLTPTSPTLAMAGFMDKVLLVVDAGKTKRDVIKRGYQDLVNSRADVSTILNKTRENLPSWLQA